MFFSRRTGVASPQRDSLETHSMVLWVTPLVGPEELADSNATERSATHNETHDANTQMRRRMRRWPGHVKSPLALNEGRYNVTITI